MADGLYPDINCFPYWLGCITEFRLHRGKNCLLLSAETINNIDVGRGRGGEAAEGYWSGHVLPLGTVDKDETK